MLKSNRRRRFDVPSERRDAESVQSQEIRMLRSARILVLIHLTVKPISYADSPAKLSAREARALHSRYAKAFNGSPLKTFR